MVWLGPASLNSNTPIRFCWKAEREPGNCFVHKTVYLSLGSNLGDRSANLNSAIEKMGKLGKVEAVSSFYESEPVEFTSQPWFVNCAVELNTEKMPKQLLSALLGIE